MLLTVTSTTAPATDLGYLLHKNPARVQSFPLTFGQAHVFWPEIGEARCTAALLLEVDPIGLSRRPGRSDAPLEPYVNDRPYVASSFLAVAMGEVFGTAMSGRSRERQALADQALPFTVGISVLPCRGGEAILRLLFEPLGYEVEAEPIPLDETQPEWGDSRYLRVRLRAEKRLAEILTHLYVLVPVLDDQKHYWVGDDEVAKLARHGEGWLATHPARDLIARRYLKHRTSLARAALERIVGEEAPSAGAIEDTAAEEASLEAPILLNDLRRDAVLAVLRAASARRILDLGCGEGQLLRALLADPAFTEIVGVDVSPRGLEIAADRLNLDRLPDRQRARIRLLHGSLTYRDPRIAGFDAAAVVEVIEHLDPHRLDAFARVLFAHTRPAMIVLTTPNVEHNVLLPTLLAGRLRHRDHRFEWTRGELQRWATAAAEQYGYAVRFESVGHEDPTYGAPTQMAVFTR